MINTILVEDDSYMQKHFSLMLESDGRFRIVGTFRDAFDIESRCGADVDLVLMDIEMPIMNGIEALKQIKQKYSTPVIMLTAVDDMDTRLLGLSNGADDYIAKPFEPKELLLRIMNILKRTKPVTTSVIKFGDFSFDTVSGILKHKEEIVKLTTAQKNIMNHFMNNINKVVSREDFARVLGTKDERSIDVAITRLRHKIEGDTKTNEFIIKRGKPLFF